MRRALSLGPDSFNVSIRFPRRFILALHALAERDERSVADTVRRLVELGARQRGADIRKLLDGDVVDA